MEVLFFIFIVGGIYVVFNLRKRVQRLERLVAGGAFDQAPILRHQPIAQPKPQQQEESLPVPVSDSLLDYIKQQYREGISKDAIKDALIAKGWQLPDIDNAFSSIISLAQQNQTVFKPLQEETTSFDKFLEWLKEDWMLKIGALLLLIGFGTLTTYAFIHDWIGEQGRIAIGITAGSLFILLGYWRIRKYINQGGVFLVLGSTIILLTVFAARAMYDMFTPLIALIIMFLSTAFVAVASVVYKSRSLSLLSLILAGIAPILTRAPNSDHVDLFAYLFIITLGAIWIVFLTGQRELTTGALIIISAYSAPHLFDALSMSPYAYRLFPLVNISTLLLFAYAFVVVFFVTNTIGILKSKDKNIYYDLVTAAGNGLFLLAWILVAAQKDWRSLIIAGWMIVFAVGAFLIFKITQRREPFYTYAGVGVAMLATATAIELKDDMAALTIAYIIEGGIISLITYVIVQNLKIAQRMSLLLIGPVILSFGSIISRSWNVGVFHKDFFVLIILGATLLGLGLFFLFGARESKDEESQLFNAGLLIVGSLYMYVLLWLSLHAWLENNNTAVMVSLFVYTIIGLIFYFYGLTAQKRSILIYGGVLVGFVVGRLLLVDVWNMELAGRIVTFFLIGALLVSTAFLGKKKHSV